MNNRLPMTKGRRAALIVGVPLAVFCIGVAGLDEVAFAAQGSYPVRLSLPASVRALSLSANAGDLSVRQSVAPRLRLTGTAKYLLLQPSVTWRSTPSGVLVTSHCRFVEGQCSFDFTAFLAAGARLSVSDGSGNITVTGLTAAHVTASDDQGNITLTFTSVPDYVRIVDELGDVTLLLPPGGTAYQISSQVSLGATTISVPRNPASVHVISVTVQNGDITISRRAHR